MKAKHLTTFLLTVIFMVPAVHAENVNVCPEPASCEIVPSAYLPLKKVSVACDDQEALTWAKKHLKEWYGKQAPEVVAATRVIPTMDAEAYQLSVKENETQVTARTLQGVRYAVLVI